MSNVRIRSSECAWHQTELVVLGKKIEGLRGWEWGKEVDKEHLFASGQHPHDIQEGNITPTGSFTVLGYERDALNRAAQKAGYSDITEVPHEFIHATLRYQRSKLDPKTFVNITGIAITNNSGSMSQGDKMSEVQLSWLAMDITLIHK